MIDRVGDEIIDWIDCCLIDRRRKEKNFKYYLFCNDEFKVLLYAEEQLHEQC